MIFKANELNELLFGFSINADAQVFTRSKPSIKFFFEYLKPDMSDVNVPQKIIICFRSGKSQIFS